MNLGEVYNDIEGATILLLNDLISISDGEKEILVICANVTNYYWLLLANCLFVEYSYSCIIEEDKRPPPNKYLYFVFYLVLHKKDRRFAHVSWIKSPVICAKCTNRENSKKSVSAVCSFIALK
jgi:hypothetical protein